MKEFKTGEYCYDIKVSTNLHIITINRIKITSAMDNILGNVEMIKVIRTNQLPTEQFIYDNYGDSNEEQLKYELEARKIISGSFSKEYLYKKEELTPSLFKRLLKESEENKIKYIKRLLDSNLKCIFTGENLIKDRRNNRWTHVYDYNEKIFYSQLSNIKYKKCFGRAGSWWEVCYGGIKYQLELKNNIFIIISEEPEFKEEKREYRKPPKGCITPKLIDSKKVNVRPMSPPTGMLFYLEKPDNREKIILKDGKYKELF